mmetsp:Transcript_31436/g.78897  ORF Transcript_31436/g.78897 Transcript_31436/m.78897 type:complete len:208 (-) Transcript_31436:97-720(-)
MTITLGYIKTYALNFGRELMKSNRHRCRLINDQKVLRIVAPRWMIHTASSSRSSPFTTHRHFLRISQGLELHIVITEHFQSELGLMSRIKCARNNTILGFAFESNFYTSFCRASKLGLAYDVRFFQTSQFARVVFRSNDIEANHIKLLWLLKLAEEDCHGGILAKLHQILWVVATRSMITTAAGTLSFPFSFCTDILPVLAGRQGVQ